MESEEEACKLEKLIINIIKRIRKDRNRACYQNISTFINRGGNKMEMDDLKETTEQHEGYRNYRR